MAGAIHGGVVVVMAVGLPLAVICACVTCGVLAEFVVAELNALCDAIAK